MHSSSLANKTIESNLLPEVLLMTTHPDESIRDKSSKVIYELVKHTAQVRTLLRIHTYYSPYRSYYPEENLGAKYVFPIYL